MRNHAVLSRLEWLIVAYDPDVASYSYDVADEAGALFDWEVAAINVELAYFPVPAVAKGVCFGVQTLAYELGKGGIIAEVISSCVEVEAATGRNSFPIEKLEVEWRRGENDCTWYGEPVPGMKSSPDVLTVTFQAPRLFSDCLREAILMHHGRVSGPKIIERSPIAEQMQEQERRSRLGQTPPSPAN